MASENNQGQIALILLAAGESSRMGHPKQLLPYKNKTLLRYSLEEVLASNAQPVVVVLGANADVVQKEISGYPIQVVLNDCWQEGMASSIRKGITTVAEMNPIIKGVILAVCDQPFMTTALLNNLIEAHQKTSKEIIVCSYDNTFGPPVFFHRSIFSELLQLKGDVGAKSIVQHHIDRAEVIPFPQGILDIDTGGDYERIKDDNY